VRRSQQPSADAPTSEPPALCRPTR
jgi:hypothetical protein